MPIKAGKSPRTDPEASSKALARERKSSWIIRMVRREDTIQRPVICALSYLPQDDVSIISCHRIKVDCSAGCDRGFLGRPGRTRVACSRPSIRGPGGPTTPRIPGHIPLRRTRESKEEAATLELVLTRLNGSIRGDRSVTEGRPEDFQEKVVVTLDRLRS